MCHSTECGSSYGFRIIGVDIKYVKQQLQEVDKMVRESLSFTDVIETNKMGN